MGLEVTSGSNFFRVFNQGFASMAEQMERDIQQYFREQVALGRNPLDVIAELEDSRKNDLGLLRKITGGVEGRLISGGNMAFQEAANKLPDGLYEWELDPFAEHCDSCLYQSQQGPREFSEIPIPSTQPTHGKDNCTSYCKCQIVPAKGA
jgi:hypothetical protein